MMESPDLGGLIESFQDAATRYSEALNQLRKHEIPEFYTKFCVDSLSPTQLDPASLILRDTFLEISGYCLRLRLGAAVGQVDRGEELPGGDVRVRMPGEGTPGLRSERHCDR